MPMCQLGFSVPTNLKLNDKLIETTVKLGNFKAKQEAVNTALAEFVQRGNDYGSWSWMGRSTLIPSGTIKGCVVGVYHRHRLRRLRKTHSNKASSFTRDYRLAKAP
jgi:hypothetical protein